MSQRTKSKAQTVVPVSNVTGVDAYAPSEIANRVASAGQVKAALPLDMLTILGLLAGVCIGFGAALFTLVTTGSTLGFGITRLAGGIAFSLGLILVVVAGAELFTGNALIVMAWAERKVSTRALARNWIVSFLANGAGAALLALAVALSGVMEAGGVKDTAIRIAEAKAAIGSTEAFVRGVLCNALVCLAVWLAFACHTVTDKILAIVLPIAAFVALGFEHSIANFYLLPAGALAGAKVGLAEMAGNLVPVTLGNLLGGAGGVAGTYWLIYLRNRHG
jgi:formate/nitrite transporter